MLTQRGSYNIIICNIIIILGGDVLKKLFSIIVTVLSLMGCGSSGGDNVVTNPTTPVINGTVESMGIEYFLKGVKTWTIYDMSDIKVEEYTMYPSGKIKTFEFGFGNIFWKKKFYAEEKYYGIKYDGLTKVLSLDNNSQEVTRIYEYENKILKRLTIKEVGLADYIYNYTSVRDGNILRLENDHGGKIEHFHDTNGKVVKTIIYNGAQIGNETIYYDSLAREIKTEDKNGSFIYLYEGNSWTWSYNGSLTTRNETVIEDNKILSHMTYRIADDTKEKTQIYYGKFIN